MKKRGKKGKRETRERQRVKKWEIGWKKKELEGNKMGKSGKRESIRAEF